MVSLVGVLLSAVLSGLATAQDSDAFTGNAQLKQALDAALIAVKSSGRLAEIDNLWTNASVPTTACPATSYPRRADAVGTFANVVDGRELRIGGTLNALPFGTNASGMPRGFDVSLAEALVAELNSEYSAAGEAPIVIKWAKVVEKSDFYGDLLFALSNANPDIDVALANVWITPARTKTSTFSCAYFTQHLRIARGPRAFAGTVTTASDLTQTGLLVGVVRGSSNADYAAVNIPAANVVTFDTFALQFAGLRDSTVNVILADDQLLRAEFGNDAAVTLGTVNIGLPFDSAAMLRLDGSQPVGLAAEPTTIARTPAPLETGTGGSEKCRVNALNRGPVAGTLRPNCDNSCVDAANSNLVSCNAGSFSSTGYCAGEYKCCEEACTTKRKKKCSGGRCRTVTSKSCTCSNSVQSQRCPIIQPTVFSPRIEATFLGSTTKNFTVTMSCGEDGECPTRFFRDMVVGSEYDCYLDANEQPRFTAPVPSLSQAAGLFPHAVLLVTCALLSMLV